MKQEEKRQQSRAAIIQAAIQEFSVHGYDEASVNRICHACQISKGKLYYHFETKEDLYLACAEWIYQQLQLHCTVPDPSVRSLEEKFYALFLERQSYLVSQPYLPGMLWEIMQQPPTALQNQLREIRKVFAAYLTGVLHQILFESGIRDEEQVAMCTEMFLIASNHTHYKSIHVWEPESSPIDKETVIQSKRVFFRKLIHTFLYGILPR